MNRLWNVDELMTLLREAGEIALQAWHAPAVELKPDRSVVTAADREIEELFARRFDHPETGTYLIGEETISAKGEAYVKAAFQGTTYVVDPIDGTAPYVSHLPLWGVSVALMTEGVLTEGAIFFPEHDELYLTCQGTLFLARGVMKGDVEMLPFTAVKVPREALKPVSITQLAMHRGWKLRFDNVVFSYASCLGAYRMLLRGDVFALVQHCKLWDLAAGLVILKAAGYSFLHEDGSDFPLDVRHGGKCILRADVPVPLACPEPLAIAATREDAWWLWQNMDTGSTVKG